MPHLRRLLLVSTVIVVVGGGVAAGLQLPGANPHSPTISAEPADSLTIVVNKQRPLSPIDYVPRDLVTVNVPHAGNEVPKLRTEAADAVEQLFAAFTEQTRLQLFAQSAYRSYDDQQETYRHYLAALGTDAANETTAKPGYSEHQTGLAIDVSAPASVCAARDCFASTPQSRWLVTNAWKYGFIIRYPQGQASVTGYSYEPWHLRYLGNDLAKTVHFSATSLEAYFTLPAAPDY